VAPKVTVLGGGRVGSAIALDLVGSGFAVEVADDSEEALARFSTVPGLTTRRLDLSHEAAVGEAVRGSDIVVGAVPGFLGYGVLGAVLRAGKPAVDISFFGEDALALEPLAREAGVAAIVDCGVAPGMSNLLLGHHAARAESVRRFRCYVAGLPALRRLPWEYKAGFSPIDVLEEYTRPARLVENGEVVVRPALSEPELLEFEGLGTLEAFNTDGLRSLLSTMRCPWMVEKTMRYPGHIDKMRLLRDAGFLGKQPIAIAGGTVRPLDLTAALLFPAWTFAEGEEDFTVMRVEIETVENGRPVRHHYELLDRYDPASRTTSMARTTGYAATAAVVWLAEGNRLAPGIHPPERWAAAEGVLDFVLSHLAARGVVYRSRDEVLS
jgi:saccharopine dehydrogenase-like NADP-dependent oxidoreductase